MAMTRHERAEAQIVVDVIVAIEIAEVRALTFLDENGIGIVSAIVAGNAQGKTLQVAFMGFGGFRRAALESFELLLQFGIHRDLQKTQARLAIRLGSRAARGRPVIEQRLSLEKELQSKLYQPWVARLGDLAELRAVRRIAVGSIKL